MKDEIMKIENDSMPIESMKRQVQVIQRLLESVLIKDSHYGVIPGCGNKPALLKAGAEKIAMVFRLAPFFTIQKTDFSGGHREYEIVCELKNIQNGMSMGQGLGSASTMESKHRYRKGETLTADPVTKAYWDAKNKNDYGKMKELSAGRTPKKTTEGLWVWAIPGDKVENEDPADQYNTVLKMAKKRALVDAVLTVTAASDIFTQDIDETIDPDAAHKNGVENEIPNNTPTKQTKKEEALKEEKKDDPKDLAKKNKNIIDVAKGTWMDYFEMPENMAKSKVKELVKDHFGIELKDYADITVEQAKAVADMLINEMTMDGESKETK